jgi:salicylate hydroxylase
MEEAVSSDSHRTYTHTENGSLMEKILSCDDSERLDHIIDIFAKKQMVGKRYEEKAWHPYFRRITTDGIVFYQNNAALFYDDCQYDNEQFKLSGTTFIHGDLHMGQFYYYFSGITNKRVFKVQRYTRTAAPITQDLKRLAANLALIAYYQGFSDMEMMEVLEMFTQQYIRSVLSPYKNSFKKQKFIENDQTHQMKLGQFENQYAIIGLPEVQHKTHNIDWRSINTVKSLIILAKQLAIATAHLHCEPPTTISLLKDVTNLMMESNGNCCTETLQTALSSIVQQQQLIKEICSFAMIYAEIAERDYRLFFKNFRNETIFQCVNTLKNAKITYPLIDIRREAVLIVGGGIGGMATALNFAQAGIRVRLIEKNPEIAEVGAGMQLAPNCSRLLDRLGILQQVQANAVFPKQIVWMDAISGERLTCIDLGDKFIETFGYPYIVVHRGDLLHALHQACLASGMVTMETNRMVIGVDERPKSMMVQCADGTRYDCDMVIAADGLWSSLRKFVCDDGAPISVGYVTYRGTIGIDQVSKEAGLENVQFWIGPDMHLVQYPIRRGELFNQAAVFKSSRLPDETDQWGTKQELNERFSIGCQSVKNALNLIQTNFRWPVYELVIFILSTFSRSHTYCVFFSSSRNPLSKWSRGRLVLLGDAAHPMLQYAAQGAAQALEDASSLVASYKKHGPRKIHTVFHEYEQERIPRSSKVVQFARDIGIFAHHGGTAKIVRDAILRMHDKNNYEFLKWLYAEKQNGDE